MNRWMGAYLSLAIAFAASAQSIALNGAISNETGKPIAGAIVSLSNQPLQDTTDENGQYTLAGASITDRVVQQLGADHISLRKGIISLFLAESGPVRIDLLDLQGRIVARLLNRHVAGGDYRFEIGRISAQLMVISVTIGQRTSTFCYIPGPEGSRFNSPRGAQPNGKTCVLVTVPASMDTLVVWKSGYVLGLNPITSYQGVVNDTLDSISLGRFSFFVISLNAILELSKSDSGFGGDFRFGMTGPGAGLRGADSICSCIAEKSMPGSSVKLWRAFLSVTADAKGRQVNAVDRVGSGPWYDRLGRLLAPTRADLINERPMNGDPVIKNDLPNEDGIPNHKPDGINTVDNHHFVTGSKPDGTIYSATTTCEDWTSKTASGKPRCGFAWPRGSGGGLMGGTNWLSGFDAGGCAAGIELVVNNLNSPIIGNAGGYGGFYCFALTP
jgi:hypothetical protein